MKEFSERIAIQHEWKVCWHEVYWTDKDGREYHICEATSEDIARYIAAVHNLTWPDLKRTGERPND